MEAQGRGSVRRPRKPRLVRVTVGLPKANYLFVRDAAREGACSLGWVIREAVKEWIKGKELKA